MLMKFLQYPFSRKKQLGNMFLVENLIEKVKVVGFVYQVRVQIGIAFAFARINDIGKSDAVALAPIHFLGFGVQCFARNMHHDGPELVAGRSCAVVPIVFQQAPSWNFSREATHYHHAAVRWYKRRIMMYFRHDYKP